jgi:hypothetical protein
MTTLSSITIKAVLLSAGPAMLSASGALDTESAFYIWFGMVGVMVGYETGFLK